MKIPLSLRTFLKFRQNIYIFKLSDNNNSQGYCYGRLPDTNSLENKKNQIKTQMWTIGVFMLKEEIENSIILPNLHSINKFSLDIFICPNCSS